MSNKRLVARLDIKGSNLVKGIQYEGLRKLGKPQDFAYKYYEHGIDEIVYIDIVASLYNRNGLHEIVKETTENIFIPITVGGGIRTLDDVEQMLQAGADKIAINTAAIHNPELISEVAKRYGSQCMVLSIQAKWMNGIWEAFYDNGRERTNKNVLEWIKEGVERGAGEILLTSVDRDGTKRGMDFELIRKASKLVNVPVIVGGGFSDKREFVDATKDAGADAVAIASLLHYNECSIEEIKHYGAENGIEVRL